ncbi:MAG: TonB-dependent receptor [Mariprofundales bacterium]|nr:TonB-dependent receptor [Mariprofundales bacterium]
MLISVIKTIVILLLLAPIHLADAGEPDGSGQTDDADELALFFDDNELMVESASRIRESISEAPAVVNIITAQQIRRLGARNLMDILITIPGFSEIQDTNEKVVAGRGVFATTTHKILLLRDGHRLNEPMFEDVMPANAISLSSIKKIEVLRGTGASLYGNAALLAIINIITLDQDDHSQVSITGGNFGQSGLDITMNEELASGKQLLFFTHIRHHKGETISLAANQDMAATPVAGSQRVEGRPFNFDIGMNYRSQRTQIAISARRAAYNTPRANNGALLTAADTLNTPIQVFNLQHLDLKLLPRWHGIEFTLRHYMDSSLLRSPQQSRTARDAPPSGRVFNLSIDSLRAGIEYSGEFTHHHGTLIAGIQLENFWLLDSSIATSFADQSTIVASPPLAKTSEWNSALYLQEKYHLTHNLTLNAGVRWSRYKAFGNAVDPRVAAIYNPVDGLYIKFIYGRAFQAPSYFYRTENKGLGYGSPNGLRAETLDNYQISVENSFGSSSWLRVSAFHNQIKGVITKPSSASTYQNLSRLTTRGVESEFKLKLLSMLELFVNHTLLWAVTNSSDSRLLSSGRLANIPRNRATAGATWHYIDTLSGSIYLNWHGAIPSPIKGATAAQSDPNYTTPAATVVNATINANRIAGSFDAQLSLHNLLNRRYRLGGTTATPYPQEGRSTLLTVGYHY